MEEETAQFILSSFPLLFSPARKEPINIGLGTGRTIGKFWPVFISKLDRFVGLHINVVATSEDSKRIFYKYFAKSANYFCLADHSTIPHFLVDGFDCCCFNDDSDYSNGNRRSTIIIKGGGGAHFREKQIALQSQYNIYIGDRSKFGKDFILPIEVNTLAINFVKEELMKLTRSIPKLRMGPSSGQERFCGPIITENGNNILDLKLSFKSKEDSMSIYSKINAIPGVLDSGFFIDIASKIISN